LAITLVIGAQWGDEGKGRIVDFLAAGADVVGRFGGGANAGHTVRVGDTTYKLRIVPSGVLAGACDCIIGPGTVVSLDQFTDELRGLAAAGVDASRVWLSDLAHILLPYHIEQDRAAERARGASALGTTGNGIGPAYVDRVARRGMRAGDLRDRALVRDVVTRRCAELGREGIAADADSILSRIEEHRATVLPHIRDTVAMIHDALRTGKQIIAEGAQGALLDVTFGTYPYVTSSTTVAGGAGAGLGFGPTAVEHVIGVAKAYATRVGAGPFPTELDDAVGERLRERGHEYGTVTGRARRCGWIDTVALRYVAAVNGLTHVAITKLDVLDGFDEVCMCTAYDGAPEGSMPFQMAAKVKPVLRRFKGWTKETTAARSFAELPAEARAFIDALATEIGVPVSYISVGPERTQIIVRESAPSRVLAARA
jgi:adenylosuccinate synthase